MRRVIRQVINFLIGMQMQAEVAAAERAVGREGRKRKQTPPAPKWHIFNSFFYCKLTQDAGKGDGPQGYDYSAVNRCVKLTTYCYTTQV